MHTILAMDYLKQNHYIINDATYTQIDRVNGDRLISFEIEYNENNKDIFEKLDKRWYMRVVEGKHEQDYVVQNIYEKTFGNSVYLVVDALDERYDILKREMVYKEHSGSKTRDAWFQWVMEGSKFKLDIQAKPQKALRIESFGYDSKLSLLFQLLDKFGLEFYFTTSTLVIIDEIGADRSDYISYGINLIDSSRIREMSGFGTYGEIFGAYLDEENKGKGRHHATYTHELAKVYGKIPIKPIVDERFTIKENMVAEVKRRVDASINISMEVTIDELTFFEEGSDVYAGDKIMIIDPRLNVKSEIRVVESNVTRNHLGNYVNVTYTLGAYNEHYKSQTADLNMYDDILHHDKLIEDMGDKIGTVMEQAGGYGNIYRSKEEPKGPNLKHGDLWYQPYWNSKLGREETRMYQYEKDGAVGKWILIGDSALSDEIKEHIDKMQEESDELKAQIDNTLEVADKSLETAKLAREEAFDSKQLAEQVKHDIEDAQQSIIDVKARADKALDEANQVKDDLSETNGIVEHQGVILEKTTESIKLKADKVLVDTINKVVTENKAQIEVHDKQIQLKANQSEVDVVKDTIKSHESEIKLNSEQIKLQNTKINNHSKEIANIKIESDKISSSVIKVENDLVVGMSNVTQTIDGIQKTVKGKAEQSQVTQMQGQISSTVEKVSNLYTPKPNMIVDSMNIMLNKSDNGTSTNHSFVDGYFSFRTGNIEGDVYNDTDALTTEARGVRLYTLSFDANSFGNSFDVYVMIGNGVWQGPYNIPRSPSGMKRHYVKVDYTSGTEGRSKPLGIRFANIPKFARFQYGKFKLVFDDVEDLYDVAYVDVVEKSEITQLTNQINLRVTKTEFNTLDNKVVTQQSQIKLLSDNIDLKVSHDNIISSINISKEMIRINSKFIHLSGTSKIDNAVIKSAMIESVTASKINTGTLNASLVNVINLNANSISTGYLSSDRIRARSITSNHLTSDAITVGFNQNSTNIKIYGDRIEYMNDGTLVGKITRVGSEYWSDTRFIGKTGSIRKHNSPNVIGIGHQLDTGGDFISFSYREKPTDVYYSSILSLDPEGLFTGNKGVTINQDLFIRGDIGVRGRATHKLKFATTRYNNYDYPSLVHTNGEVGIFFGTGELYFLAHNKVTSLSRLLG